MFFSTIIPIAFALSADAFAVAFGRGASGRTNGLFAVLGLGLLFGTAEAGMTLLGYLAAAEFTDHVAAFDHWIAFVLLCGVGGHMLVESLSSGHMDTVRPRPRSLVRNVATALGTSIDSAAVGVALSLIAVDLWLAISTIGIVSFLMSTTGLLIGGKVAGYLGRHAESAGGALLIAMGIYIFLSHTLSI